MAKKPSRTELLLSNCAYWAVNALGVKGSPGHVGEIQKISLLNILEASREFAIVGEDNDSTVCYQGIKATYIPEDGWRGWKEAPPGQQ